MTLTRCNGPPSAPVGAVEDGMHEFKAHGSRQRGLFPVPCENGVSKTRGGLSRGCRQRAGDVENFVSESQRWHALNSLYGVEDFPAAQRTSPAQDEYVRQRHAVAKNQVTLHLPVIPTRHQMLCNEKRSLGLFEMNRSRRTMNTTDVKTMPQRW